MKTFLALLLPSLLSAPTLELPVRWPVPAFALRLSTTQTGLASYYGEKFHGKIMRNGKRYDRRRLTAASNDIPLGKIVTVTRRDRPWRSVKVTITDQGNLFGRTLDLSQRAAKNLGMITQGVVSVIIQID